MFIKILIGLAAIVALILIAGAFQPAQFRVTRSVRVAAAPAAVFAHVNDLHRYQGWNPFSKLDPAATHTFEGPGAGTGAVLAWDGNNQIGAGRMTLVESRPDELVKFKLEFKRPMEGGAEAAFTFKPESGETLVTWDMTGERNYICKVMGMFINMDKMIGGTFEDGLASLKSTVESAPSL